MLVADAAGEIVAVGEYYVSPSKPTRAEVAFAVLDRMQHRGLATSLLRELRSIALGRDVREFRATVLATNRAMMDVFQDCGLSLRVRLRDGVYDVSLDLVHH